MNPQAQNNPFLATLQKLQQGGGQQQQGAANPMAQQAIQMPAGGQAPSGTPAGMASGAGGAGGVAAKAMMPSNTPGANPGSTDSLIKALGAMNQVITATDDPQEIQLARQVILLLQKMVQMDQQKQGGRESALGQAQQGAQQFPPQSLQAAGGLPQGTVPGGTPPSLGR